jgi:hypothetical protein
MISLQGGTANLRVTEFHVYGPFQKLQPFPDAQESLAISTVQEMNIFPLGEPIAVEAIRWTA